MQYEVHVIGDGDLDGEDWAFVREGDRSLTFYIKETAAACPQRLKAALEEAWSADRQRRVVPVLARMAAC